MVRTIVMVKMPGGQGWQDFGHVDFEVLPRIGEYIELLVTGAGKKNEEGEPYLFTVVSIVHPSYQGKVAICIFASLEGKHEKIKKALFEV
jgi:hypothetical protein